VSSTNRSTTNLLRRYLNGAITAPEEAELERRAQTDEPLAEAMRGLQSAPEEDHTARVSRMLDAARQQGKTSTKVIRARPNRFRWAAAAVVLLLVASSLFFLPSLLDNNVGDLAMTSAPQSEAPSPVAKPPLELPPTEALALAPEGDTEAGTSPAPSSSTQDLRSRPENNRKNKPKTGTTSGAEEQQTTARNQAAKKKRKEVVQKEEQRTPSLPPPAFDDEAEVVVAEEMADELEVLGAQRTPPPPPSPSVAIAPAAAPASIANSGVRAKLKENQPEAIEDAPTGYTRTDSPAGAYLNGRITNENGYPILNALVRLPGLPLGERTDTNGVFQLPADAAATSLVISHPDYESERVDLTDLAEKLQISLERKEFIDEDNRPRWQQNGASTLIVFDEKPGYASPLEGYNALRLRIEENKPPDVSKGKVKLSFLVNPDGTLTDIQFRGKPDRATMDYIGRTLVSSSVWEVVEGDEPVRVYFKVVFK
jgi:hypothetical protein